MLAYDETMVTISLKMNDVVQNCIRPRLAIGVTVSFRISALIQTVLGGIGRKTQLQILIIGYDNMCRLNCGRREALIRRDRLLREAKTVNRSSGASLT